MTVGCISDALFAAGIVCWGLLGIIAAIALAWSLLRPHTATERARTREDQQVEWLDDLYYGSPN